MKRKLLSAVLALSLALSSVSALGNIDYVKAATDQTAKLPILKINNTSITLNTTSNSASVTVSAEEGTMSYADVYGEKSVISGFSYGSVEIVSAKLESGSSKIDITKTNGTVTFTVNSDVEADESFSTTCNISARVPYTFTKGDRKYTEYAGDSFTVNVSLEATDTTDDVNAEDEDEDDEETVKALYGESEDANTSNLNVNYNNVIVSFDEPQVVTLKCKKVKSKKIKYQLDSKAFKKLCVVKKKQTKNSFKFTIKGRTESSQGTGNLKIKLRYKKTKKSKWKNKNITVNIKVIKSFTNSSEGNEDEWEV